MLGRTGSFCRMRGSSQMSRCQGSQLPPQPDRRTRVRSCTRQRPAGIRAVTRGGLAYPFFAAWWHVLVPPPAGTSPDGQPDPWLLLSFPLLGSGKRQGLGSSRPPPAQGAARNVPSRAEDQRVFTVATGELQPNKPVRQEEGVLQESGPTGSQSAKAQRKYT